MSIERIVIVILILGGLGYICLLFYAAKHSEDSDDEDSENDDEYSEEDNDNEYTENDDEDIERG